MSQETNKSLWQLKIIDRNDNARSYDFAPGMVIYEEHADGKSGHVISFVLNGKFYGYQKDGHDAHAAATYLHNVGKNWKTGLTGGAIGASAGRPGIVIGMLVGLKFEEIKKLFDEHSGDP